MSVKKLIEVSLPLDEINKACVREKSIRHGHPSTLHLWWARRPLAAARAVIWASLVDDPSSHPEQFPTEEAQQKERDRLHGILKRLIIWENSNNQAVLDEAKAEIMKSTNGNPPPLLDPFAGGGAIPLEAMRLGLEAHAHDLNPVAVMINKAMIELPAKFTNLPPVHPKSTKKISTESWEGSEGLAEDIRYYGEMTKHRAYERIGHLYPEVSLPREHGGGKAPVIAWIWTRTAKCPNPACGGQMPIVKSFILSNVKNKECHIRPHSHNKQCVFSVERGSAKDLDGTYTTTHIRCIHCNETVPLSYLSDIGTRETFYPRLLAIVAEAPSGRVYLDASSDQVQVADIARVDTQLGELSRHARPKRYGFTTIDSLFSNRQLLMLSTFSDLVGEVRDVVLQDAKAAGIRNPEEYANAISVYLTFVVDKMADRASTICSWDGSRQGLRNTFGMTGLSMTWDYAEANPFSNSSGCWDNMLEWVVKAAQKFPSSAKGNAVMHNAQAPSALHGIMVSTDPPYYDNVPYAAFSDFFYAWMRRSLKPYYPDIFSSLQTPKMDELVADAFRHGGKDKAAAHFEEGMLKACRNIYEMASPDYPVTIYYAYKQTDRIDANSDDSAASTGWEKMLTAIIQSGFAITGTWPIRTEMANRSRSIGSNALASSIVLVCRKREENARICSRRQFVNALRSKLPPALEKLKQSNLAPVDMAQSAIGPGMELFSQYEQVLEADGSPMRVRTALQIINQELDACLNEGGDRMDAASLFCIDLYSQYAYNKCKYGDADTLARAKNTSVEAMAKLGVLEASGGYVALKERAELPEEAQHSENCLWLLTQQAAHALNKNGVAGCARLLAGKLNGEYADVKTLAYRLFALAEKKGWSQDAQAYNELVISWPEIEAQIATEREARSAEQQREFDFS